MSQGTSTESFKLAIGALSVLTIILVFEYALVTNIVAIPIPRNLTGAFGFLLRTPFLVRTTFVALSVIIFFTIDKSSVVSDLLDKYSIAKYLSSAFFILTAYTLIIIQPVDGFTYRFGMPIVMFCFFFSGFIAFNMVRKSKPNLLKTPFGFKKVTVLDQNNYSFNWRSKTEGFLNIRNPMRGLLICGNAGSGKGWKAMEPILDQVVWKGYTGLIYDFKSPVLTKYVHNQFINYRIQNSKTERRKLWCIDFADLSKSHRCNPISPKYMKTASDANEMAITLLSNLDPNMIEKPDFFNKSSVVILKTIFWFLKKRAPQNCTIPHAIAIAQMPYEKVIAMLKTDEETSRMIEVLAMADRKKAEGQLAGQVASLLIPADVINSPEISYVLSEDDFSLDLNNPEAPGLLCLGNNVARQGTYGPVVALIATVIMKQLNAPNKLHSVFALDEAPTLYIPNYDSSGPATARSNLVSHIYICQALSQIKSKYGDKLAGNIIGTLGTHIYLQSSLIEDASVVARMIGRAEKEQESVSTSKNGKKTGSNHSTTRLNLIEDEEMMILEVGRMVGKVSETNGKYPSIFNIKPDTKEKQRDHLFNSFVYRERTDEDTLNSPDGKSKNLEPLDNETIYHEIAVKKHRYISWQATELVNQFAREAILQNIAVEKVLFPEHFSADGTRIITLWGDPVDASGIIRHRVTNMVVGTIREGYFETVNRGN
jgi:hypothetical protein